MEICTACKETGVFETLHIMIRLLCSHWIHARYLEKSVDCVECRPVYVIGKRKLFMRAKVFAERKIPEEFSKCRGYWNETIFKSGCRFG